MPVHLTGAAFLLLCLQPTSAAAAGDGDGGGADCIDTDGNGGSGPCISDFQEQGFTDCKCHASSLLAAMNYNGGHVCAPTASGGINVLVYSASEDVQGCASQCSVEKQIGNGGLHMGCCEFNPNGIAGTPYKCALRLLNGDTGGIAPIDEPGDRFANLPCPATH
eukprot:gene11943-2178_t